MKSWSNQINNTNECIRHVFYMGLEANPYLGIETWKIQSIGGEMLEFPTVYRSFGGTFDDNKIFVVF